MFYFYACAKHNSKEQVEFAEQKFQANMTMF